LSEEDKDDDSEGIVERQRRKSDTFLSMQKYVRMTQQVAFLKSELALSRKSDRKARAELAKLRDEVLVQGNEKSDNDERTNQLILKHSAKAKAKKALSPKTYLSKQKKKTTTRSNKKRAVRKSTSDLGKDNDSDSAEDEYSVASEGSGPGSLEGPEPLEDRETESVHSDKVNRNIEKIDPTTPTIEKTKVNGKEGNKNTGNKKKDNEKADDEKKDNEKADKCEGHKNLLNFLFEDDPRYCAEGQKFRDATCMKCSSTFVTKDTKPNSSRPIHFCPYFEEVCDAVLCHGCYMELNSSTTSSRSRWNRNQNV
jgi:hypothetical protein